MSKEIDCKKTFDENVKGLSKIKLDPLNGNLAFDEEGNGYVIKNGSGDDKLSLAHYNSLN